MNITKINTIVIKKFANAYRLPLISTAIFIAIVVFLIMGRLHDRTVLGQILTIKNSGGDGYANLLSQDKADDYSKNDIPQDENTPDGSDPVVATSVSPNNPSPNPTTESATPSQATVPAAPGSASTPVSPSPASPSPSAPPAVFSASVTEFKLARSPLVQCTNGSAGNLNLSKCSKKYSFSASFQTLNGPGTVSYGWVYSVNGSNGGTVVVAAGSVETTLANEITLSCLAPGPFTAKFSISQPSVSESQTLIINHNCA